jgi:hypothetical protein
MPNGELYANPGVYYIGDEPPEPHPMVWDNKSSVEYALNTLREQAKSLGVEDWLGVVVRRVCSEFSTADPVAEFASEIEKWAAEQ